MQARNRTESFAALRRMEFAVQELRNELTVSVSITTERSMQIHLAATGLIEQLREDAKTQVELPKETYARTSMRPIESYGIAPYRVPEHIKGVSIS